MTDILAISPASATAINRNVYVELKMMGWDIEMLIPETYPLSSGKILKSETARPIDPKIYFYPLHGNNPRLFSFPGLKKLLDDRKPSIVILENDPVSQMAIEAGHWCKLNNAYLFCLSCENLSFDIIPTLKRRGLKAFPGAIVKWYLNHISKKSF